MEEQGHLVTFESLLLSSRFAFACGRNDSPILRTVSKEGSEVNCAFKYPSVQNIFARESQRVPKVAVHLLNYYLVLKAALFIHNRKYPLFL